MDMKSKLGLKFVMAKLKRLITDETSGLGRMENLDDIIKDIFGVKNFTKKLNDCYDDKESIIIINEIGMKNLMNICNTPRIYSVFTELVVMNAEIHRIHRALRKAERKGKNKDKKLVKEYNYLLDSYRRAVKALRKKFGTTNKSSYKKKFRSVNDLIDTKKGFSYYDDDGESISSVLYDDELYSDDDEEDDGDGLSDFEKYVQRAVNPSKVNKKKDERSIRSNRIDFEDDTDDDDLDDLDEDDEILEQKIDDLTNKMSTLTSAIQALVNNANHTQHQGQVAQPPVYTAVLEQTADNNMAELTKSIMYLAKCQKDSIEKQDAILGCLETMVLDEDDDEEYYNGIKPVVGNEGSPTLKANVRKVETTLSTEEVINIVNNEGPANLGNSQHSEHREPKPGGQS